MTAVANERIQLRVSLDAKTQIFKAASITEQDATSFILDAASARARRVLLEEKLLSLSMNDMAQIEQALDEVDAESPKLTALFEALQNDERFAK